VTGWARREPVTLAGHSWGVYPLTGAAILLGAELIREVVVPERGVAMRDKNPAMASIIDAQLESSQSISASPSDVAAQMMQDESPVATTRRQAICPGDVAEPRCSA